MANYTQNTLFTPKDSLSTGDPEKKILGADFDAEFAEIAARSADKEDVANKGAASGYCPLNGSTKVDGSLYIEYGTSANTAAEGNHDHTSITGTAAALTTPVNIGNVSFDGSASIVPQQIDQTSGVAGATWYPMLAANSTAGAERPNADPNLEWDANAQELTCPTVIANLTGNVTGNASTATVLATPRLIGGISFNGSGDITPQNISITTDSGNATHYVGFYDATTGNQRPKTDGGLTYNPSSNILSVSNITLTSGATVNDIDTAMATTPTDSQLLTAQAIKEEFDDLGAATQATVTANAALAIDTPWTQIALDGTQGQTSTGLSRSGNTLVNSLGFAVVVKVTLTYSWQMSNTRVCYFRIVDNGTQVGETHEAKCDGGTGASTTFSRIFTLSNGHSIDADIATDTGPSTVNCYSGNSLTVEVLRRA